MFKIFLFKISENKQFSLFSSRKITGIRVPQLPGRKPFQREKDPDLPDPSEDVPRPHAHFCPPPSIQTRRVPGSRFRCERREPGTAGLCSCQKRGLFYQMRHFFDAGEAEDDHVQNAVQKSVRFLGNLKKKRKSIFLEISEKIEKQRYIFQKFFFDSQNMIELKNLIIKKIFFSNFHKYFQS